MRPSPRLLLFAVLALALFLRLGHWAAVRGQPFVAELLVDSAEYDRWAREIAAGAWLGKEPFFQAPLYPYLLATVYTLFGHRLDAVYLLQIALAVAGCWALYRVGRRLAGEGVGLAAAALAATYGPFIFHDVLLLKESLVVSGVSFLLWGLVAARERPLVGRWVLCGLLCGALALLRENLLLMAPLLPLAALGRTDGEEGGMPGWRRLTRAAGGLLAGLVLILSPVAAHNAWAGGGFLPTTFQGGVNLWIGNNPEADGTYRPLSPGKQTPAYERSESVRLAEAGLGRDLTAGEVSRYWSGRALAWARSEPWDFLRLQVRKLGMFWGWYEWPDTMDYYYFRHRSPVLHLPLWEFGGVTILAGVGLWFERRRLGRWWPALLFILTWTFSTVIFFLFSRYRLPVVPALLLLAGVPLAQLARNVGRGRWLRVAALTALVTAAWALPQLAGFEPRMDAVHHNLGRLNQESGRPVLAMQHYEQATELNRADFLSPLNLGILTAQQGAPVEALKWFHLAEQRAPGSGDVQACLGRTYLMLDDAEKAQEYLDRALALDPHQRLALYNRALLAFEHGDLETARGLDRRLLELVPDHSAGRQLAERLEAPHQNEK